MTLVWGTEWVGGWVEVRDIVMGNGVGGERFVTLL